MSTYLPKDVQRGLEAARKLARAKKNRLRVKADGEVFRVIRFWENGFAVEVETAPHLRGLVDIYDGADHLCQCLIVASDEEGGEMRYDFKRATAASDRPPLDFVRSEDAPVALIARD